MVFSDFRAASDNAALKDIILERVRRAGRVPFSEFMELALYHPAHGYYVTQDPTLDYQSSPNVHPIFGAVLASQLAEFWRILGQPARFQVFEAGAHRGQLAGDILRWLRGHEPDFYEVTEYTIHDRTLAEGSAGLERIGLPPERLRTAEDLPDDDSLEGCVLSNELLDALPVRRVRVEGGRLEELYIAAEGERLVDEAGEPSAEVVAYFETLGLLPGEGCTAEVNLEAPRWVERAAATLRRGYVLTLDYGYEAQDLYAPWRKQGTLLTFYRHTAADDPYVRIGRQDITASVDFTTIRRAGEAAGLRTVGVTSQGHFLAALGIGSAVQRGEGNDMEGYFAIRKAVTELTDMAGLGRIKVLLQGKDVPDALPRGFEGAGT